MGLWEGCQEASCLSLRCGAWVSRERFAKRRRGLECLGRSGGGEGVPSCRVWVAIAANELGGAGPDVEHEPPPRLASSSNLDRQHRQLRMAGIVAESDLCRFLLESKRHFIRTMTLGIFPTSSGPPAHADDVDGDTELGARVGGGVTQTEERVEAADARMPGVDALLRLMEDMLPKARVLEEALER